MTLGGTIVAQLTCEVVAPAVELNVSENAAVEIKKFMSGEDDLPETAGLRVRVVPGGCSGFQYSLNIEEHPLEEDHVLPADRVRIFVDGFRLQYLKGVTVDYVTSMQGSGFTFSNPNATGGCGCGTSFTA